MWIQSLGGEDPLEQGMATHSSILAWRIPWTEEPGGLTVDGVPKIWIQLKRLNMYACRIYIYIIVANQNGLACDLLDKYNQL